MKLEKVLKGVCVVIWLVAGICLIDFHLSNNWIQQEKSKQGYYFRDAKTRGLFTRRIFIKEKVNEGSIREAYHEYNFFGTPTKNYVDFKGEDANLPDGLVDRIYGSGYSEPLEMTREKDYKWFKPKFDKANKELAKNRADFVEDMQKFGIN